MSTQEPQAPDAQAPLVDPPLTPEDQEAEAEAMAELRRQDVAEDFLPGAPAPPPISRYVTPMQIPPRQYSMPEPRFAPAPPPPQRPDLPGPAPNMMPPVGTTPAPEWGVSGSKDLKTLEDLYTAYPSIGDGQTFLRVERLQPKVFQGHAVAGWLGDLHEKIPMEEFAYQYGGQKYRVSVMVPVRGQVDPGGKIPYRRMSGVELTFPGPPAQGAIPREEDAMSTRMPGMVGGRMMPQQLPYGSEPEQVQLARLQMEDRERQRQEVERQRLNEEARQAHRTPSELFGVVKETSDRAVNQAEKSAEERVQVLRNQNDALLLSHKEKDQELRDANKTIIDLRGQLSEAKYHTENEQVKQLKDRYETDLRRDQATHAAEVARQAEQHRVQVAEITQRHTQQIAELAQRHNDERQKLIETEQRERMRIQEISGERERSTKENEERRNRDQKDAYEGRIADQKHQFDMQLESLKSAHARELQAVQTATQTEVKFSEKTANLERSTIAERVTRAENENLSLRRENDDLRAKLNKPFPEAMREAREVGMMIGLVDKADNTPAPEEEVSWQKAVSRGVVDLIQKAPEIAKEVMQVRNQNQAAAQQRAIVAQQQQANAQAQQQANAQAQQGQFVPPGMAPAPRPQRRNIMAPPPSWAQPAGPPPPGMAPAGPPPMVSAPIMGAPPTGAAYIQAPPPPAVITTPYYGPPDTPAAEEVRITHSPVPNPFPETQAAPVSQGAQVMGPPPIQPPPGHVPQGPPPQQAGPAQPMPQINEQMVAEFINSMDSAVKFVPAEAFARGVIERAGAPVVGQLLGVLSPDQVFRLVESHPQGASSQILTRDGQKFVREVWQAALRQLRDQGVVR